MHTVQVTYTFFTLKRNKTVIPHRLSKQSLTRTTENDIIALPVQAGERTLVGSLQVSLVLQSLLKSLNFCRGPSSVSGKKQQQYTGNVLFPGPFELNPREIKRLLTSSLLVPRVGACRPCFTFPTLIIARENLIMSIIVLIIWPLLLLILPVAVSKFFLILQTENCTY